MNALIEKSLREIEVSENVRILLAVESGSRAWGFPSPDSDYDVRFIYVRSLESYLQLNSVRDVIERPIDAVLDINGWDLRKTLMLLHGANPTLFEWFSSPILYRETEFSTRFKPIMAEYFSSKKALYHYLRMAAGNYGEHLCGSSVRAKKYFYVLRPLLACRWILDFGVPPPMSFFELMKVELEDALHPCVRQLLDIKMNAPEIREIPRIDALNAYIEENMEALRIRISALPEEKAQGWEPLNALFLKELGL